MNDWEMSVDYFKNQKGYDRIFLALRKKWERNGKCTGVIQIKNATEQERTALRNLLGRTIDDENIRFRFQEFVKAYEESSIYSATFEQVLCAYFGEPLLTNKESREHKARQKQSFFECLIKETKPLGILESTAFFTQLEQGESIAASFVAKEYHQSPELLHQMLINAWKAVAFLLQKKTCRIAVLSTEITGNPHYFDRGLVSGKALLYVLAFYYDVPFPKNAEDVIKLYDNAGIITDEISNFTAAFGIHLYDSDGLHPAFEAFIERKEPYLVSSFHLNHMIKAMADSSVVYAVENQMLYSHLCEVLSDESVALLCTSGQPKAASLLMLDLLCDGGCTIYYAGDLDPEGIMIVDRLMSRNPAHIRPWRFTVDDYYQSLSNEVLSESRLKQLDRIHNSCFHPLCEAVKKQKKAGYQEALLEGMIEDVKSGMK